MRGVGAMPVCDGLEPVSPRAASVDKPYERPAWESGVDTSRSRLAWPGVPAVLWNFPGSGSTWTNALVSWCSGLGISSAYYNPNTAEEFSDGAYQPFSRRSCERFRIVVVKAHPTDALGLLSDPARGRRICGGGSLRVIIVVRHPLAAIWSEFKRASSYGHEPTPQGFRLSMDRWHNALANASEQWAELWRQPSGEYYRWFTTQPANSTLLLRYEDLLKAALLPEMVAEMLRFIGVVPNASKIACGIGVVSGQTRATWSKLQPAPFGAARVTLREALANDVDRTHRAWARVRRVAGQLGYALDPNAPPRSERLNARLAIQSIIRSQRAATSEVAQARGIR